MKKILKNNRKDNKMILNELLEPAKNRNKNDTEKGKIKGK